MQDLKGKKLLVIGGAFQHCKIVEAAKEMGVTVYVTDYLPPEQSPAKEIADHYFMYNITDIDEMVEACRREKIDGVLAMDLDACQRPYQQVCEKLGVPCYGTKEQFFTLTDKNAFKKCCIENGVDVIPEYREEDFASEEICVSRVQFPILVKPCDSRGSRGITICHDFAEAKAAIPFAKSESSNGNIVIEKYMGSKNDFSVTYFVINGEPYLFRSGDRYLGPKESKMDRSAVFCVAPSKNRELYWNNVHPRVVRMLKAIGLKNGPMFMQGFVDGDTVRFYDPGLRCPGVEYERMYERACGINIVPAMVHFALTGELPKDFAIEDPKAELNGKQAIYMLPALKPGTIGRIEGVEKIMAHPDVVSMSPKYKVGDTVGEHYNVKQRFAEIDLVCDSKQERDQLIHWIYDTLRIENEQGEDMLLVRTTLDEVP